MLSNLQFLETLWNIEKFSSIKTRQHICWYIISRLNFEARTPLLEPLNQTRSHRNHQTRSHRNPQTRSHRKYQSRSHQTKRRVTNPTKKVRSIITSWRLFHNIIASLMIFFKYCLCKQTADITKMISNAILN